MRSNEQMAAHLTASWNYLHSTMLQRSEQGGKNMFCQWHMSS